MICPETKRACEKHCDDEPDDIGVCWYRTLRATWFWIGFAACGVLWLLIR